MDGESDRVTDAPGIGRVGVVWDLVETAIRAKEAKEAPERQAREFREKLEKAEGTLVDETPSVSSRVSLPLCDAGCCVLCTVTTLELDATSAWARLVSWVLAGRKKQLTGHRH